MPISTVTTSAAGSLALLEDDDKDIRVYALTHLLTIVGNFWAEISEKIVYIEQLADPQSKELPIESQPYAALLCAKIYFYLGLQDEAVEFALRAGEVFEHEPEGEFRQTVIAGCLDRAIDETSNGETVDSKLAIIVEGVVKSSSTDGKLAIGLALSLRRLDLIEMLFVTSRVQPQASSSSKPSKGPLHDEALLRYILGEVVGGASGNDAWPVSFRSSLLKQLLRHFKLSHDPDYNSITQIWVQLEDATAAAETLAGLLGSDNVLEAYQIGFDLSEMATQGFIHKLIEQLAVLQVGESQELPSNDPRNILGSIITGVKSAELFLNFLSKNNKSDMAVLKGTKESLEDRYSIYHSAITFANAFAHCGTTSDRFLRENLDWLGRASNWAKFSATAALGVIHRGSWVNGIRVVTPYLPGGVAPSKFSEGGALYALGLIHAGRKEGAEEELRKALAEGNDPIVQHGAALGLGICAIGTADEDIYEEMRSTLFEDSATAGEATGYAMGLVMLGTGNVKAMDEMISYARETEHEKIIRSLAVGIALCQYGQREKAEPMISMLSKEKDAILRYGGMYTLALAYAGTANNGAIRRLLHVAVSDVNDDVRRAAVTCLGFVLFRNHTQVPRVVELLAESYNPHVRHGATLALGIACAGTGLEAAIELLEPMTKDPVDFVRQGAYISLAMILIQQSEAQSPKAASIRETFSKVVADKHEDPIARFGASLAQGIVDAGGRNMTLSMSTRAGTPNMSAIVGMTLFVQTWYWFPLAHCLSLAFSPTAIIALDQDMRIPKIDLSCASKPSLFAYPPVLKKKEEKAAKKTLAAVLSTTAKAQARAKSKKAADGEAMDMDDKATEEEKAESVAPKKERKPAEPTSFTLQNMTRVTPQQLQFISYPKSENRYQPIRPIGESNEKTKISGGSVIMLRDSKSGGEGEYIELDRNLWPKAEKAETVVAEEPVPVPVDSEVPAPFENA
ncbi:26S proteasome regulatory subunit N2, partial [Tremellales sp. Uapishka_1]